MVGLNHDTVHGIAPVVPEDRRTTNRSLASVSIRVLVLAVAVQLCFGQADRTDIHVTPRFVRSSSPSEGRPKNGAAEPFKATANLVLVPVTVTDQKDRVVIGVEKDNFSVFDGQERQVLRHL